MPSHLGSDDGRRTLRSGEPIQNDKWNVFLPGKNEAGSGTFIRGLRPQEVTLSAALVDNRSEAVTKVPIDPKQTTSRVVWELLDPTTYPGVATNAGALDDRSLDLSFRPLTDAFREVRPLDVRRHFGTSPLFVKDYAAEGKIKATWHLVKTASGQVFPTSLATERALPLDTDGDYLPDRWEKEEAAKVGRGPDLTALDARTDVDVDRFNNSHRTGDGLTAGEEYRGFFVGDVHKRTDEMTDETRFAGTNPGGPFRKDLKPGSAEYIAAIENVLAHEVGHRYTLAHPTFRTTVSRVLASDDSPLLPGELAAFLPDGRSLRTRVVIEEHPFRFFPGVIHLALQRPIDLTFPGGPTVRLTSSPQTVRFSPVLPRHVIDNVPLNSISLWSPTFHRDTPRDLAERTGDIVLGGEIGPPMCRPRSRFCST